MDIISQVVCQITCDSLCPSSYGPTVTAEQAAALNKVTPDDAAWAGGLLAGGKVYCCFDATQAQQAWIREESDAEFVRRGDASCVPHAVRVFRRPGARAKSREPWRSRDGRRRRYLAADRTLTVTPPRGASAVWVEERRGDGRKRSTVVVGVARAAGDAVFAMPHKPGRPTHIAVYALSPEGIWRSDHRL